MQYLLKISTIENGGERMIIRYNIPRLRQLIENLFHLTGVSLSVLDTEYRRLAHCSYDDDFCTLLQGTENAAKNCKNCDLAILKKCGRTRKLEGHICTAGLYDCAMPIMKYDTLVGYVIMGRVRSAKSPETPRNIPAEHPEIYSRFLQKYRQLPIMTEKQLAALYALLPTILFDHAIEIVYDPFANELAQYIEDNLQKNLSVGHLCDRFHISPNHLYSVFHKNFDRTVNAYITAQRLERAKKLLLESNEPVYSIADTVGIGNYTYFCKLFKKEIGLTPVQYRENRSE